MKLFACVSSFALLAAVLLLAQNRSYVPVTAEMLANPNPNDWLMYSRTYDAQRYSPLKQINKGNVGQLRMAWSRQHGAGSQESIPLVHDGVMYILAPSGVIQALDATNGDLKWEYTRRLDAGGGGDTKGKAAGKDAGKGGKGAPKGGGAPNASQSRSKTIAMWGDMIYTTTVDSYVVAIDAKTGEERWAAKTDTRGATQGTVIAGDMVISGGTCGGNHANCYISAHDARTGELKWKFFTAANDDDPGGASWNGTPENERFAGTWGLGGTYDPAQKLVIWSVANPTPNTRFERHNNNPMGTGTAAPADLYSNSTIAIDVETGKLKWYYQYLPGDDWDEDFTNERILVTSPMRPTAQTAKWFNKNLRAGEQRDAVIAIGEPGGIFAVDRKTGEFLWANPWPYDVPNFILSDIDDQGKTHINQDLIFTGPNQRKLICFFNTKSYWPAAYSPATNSIYAPFVDTCLDMRTGAEGTRPVRNGTVRPGINPNEFSGVSKIDVATGKVEHIYKGAAPINGAILATAGDVIFFGDLDRRLRALDAQSGKVLWEQIVGGPIANSTITYAVNGKQYVAVLTGSGLLTPSVIGYAPGINPPAAANGVYVFALP